MEQFLDTGFEEVDDYIKKIIDKTKMFVIPNTWVKIGNGAFNSVQQLKKIEMGDNVIELGMQSFVNCAFLESVKLSNKIRRIPTSAFNNCSSLEQINMPKNLEAIDEQAFDSCKSLKSVVFPNTLKSIGFFAFCSSGLTKIELPESLRNIGEGAFCTCHNLQEITIPKNVEYLGEEVFFNCMSLKKTELSENLWSVGERCFSRCFDLEEVQFGKGLKEICDGAFGECYKLKHITLPEGLKTINKGAFGRSGLNEAVLPESLENLGDVAFGECKRLKAVKFNSNLKYIPEGCFVRCISLNELIIPSNIKEIKYSAFAGCEGLKTLRLENGVEVIGEVAFGGCRKLEEVNLPASIKYVSETAFTSCNKLNTITFPKDCDFKCKLPFKPAYITYKDGYFTITKQKRKNAYKCTEECVGLMLLNFDNKAEYLKRIEDKPTRDLYENMFAILKRDDFESFMQNKNLKFYKRLYDACNLAAVDPKDKQGVYTLLYNLGAFEGKRQEEVTTKSGSKIIDVFPAQKVCEYFINLNVDFSVIGAADLFDSMGAHGYKHEFTEFLLSGNNLEEMVNLTNSEGQDFVSKCYNEFEAVQRTNTSNKGSQRQLKPNIEKFVSYFKTSKFGGVTPETEKLALTISPYFNKQISFDRAKEILEEHKSKQIPVSIIDLQKYEKIDEYAQTILNLANDTLKKIKTVTNDFDYEWLKKNDERIFTLGKVCDCCAHLEGQGYGIMRAGIIHPSVQNMAIKNEKGQIIAKATIYVNKQNGHAVFNTVSLKREYKKQANKVYEKFIEGVKFFAYAYNSGHQNAPLKTITVGMNLNGIEKQIRQNNKPSEIIYDAPNYGMYGVSGARYRGDSEDEQYVVWEANNERSL